MPCHTTKYLLALGCRETDSLRGIIQRDAVPNVSHKLEALGNRQGAEVGGNGFHGISVCHLPLG